MSQNKVTLITKGIKSFLTEIRLKEMKQEVGILSVNISCFRLDATAKYYMDLYLCFENARIPRGVMLNALT